MGQHRWGATKLKLHWAGDHPRVANDRAVTAKERSRHTDAGNNEPNGRWLTGPPFSASPAGRLKLLQPMPISQEEGVIIR